MKMGNSVVVYRSKREQMMDEFWMSEDGANAMFIMVLFFIAALGAARLYEKSRGRRGML